MTPATQPSAGRQLSVRARIVRWIGRLAGIVALGAMLVYVGIFVAHLPAWVPPPHHPSLSVAYTPPFSSPGLTSMPIEGWAALAVVAWTVRGAITHYWPSLRGHETTTD
jgi:hypothetical protein